MWHINFQPLIDFLHANPHAGGIFTFFVVFAEAMAVIGVVIPGSITMSVIGILIGSAVIPAGSTLLYAIAGAITGDYLSYFIGAFFKDRLHKLWIFRKYPRLLERSEKFFRDHGGKSVFLGRFVAPTRAMIPMIAGMLKMPIGRFTAAALPSATIWAVGYMLPGILLGALSLELPPKAATKFTLVVVAVIVIAWVIFWLTQHFFKKICRLFDNLIKWLWNYLQQHRTLNWLPKLLSDPSEPNHHQQLTLLILAIISGLMFFFVFTEVIANGFLTGLNEPVCSLLTSFRSHTVDRIAVVVTMMGEVEMLMIAASIFLLWLVWKRYWYIAIHWVAIVGLTGIVVQGMKYFINSPRPGMILHLLHSSSFPSGHAAFSLALFGFLAVIIARELTPKRRIIPYILAASFTLSIAFSRIFLGAHWVTDLLGSLFLALTLVLLVTISYRRRHIKDFSTQGITVAVLSIFVSVWLIFSVFSFSGQIKNYALIWPVRSIDKISWRDQTAGLPLFRLNRLGHPIQAFNVQWVGSLENIRHSLLKQGWQELPGKLSLLGVIQSISPSGLTHHLSPLTQLYHNQKPALLLLMETDEERVVLILRLWKSDVTISDYSQPLWIGVVESHRSSPKIFTINHQRHKPFFGATESLTDYLQAFRWQEVVVPIDKQPAIMQDLSWDGKLLLIQPK